MKIVYVLPAYTNLPSGGFHVHYQYADLLSRRGHDVTIVFPRRLEKDAGELVSRLKAPLWALRLRIENRPLIRWLPADSKVKVRLVRSLDPRLLPDADLLIATHWPTAEALAKAPPRCGRKFYIVYDYEFVVSADEALRERIEATYRLPFGIISTSTVVDETVRRAGGDPLAKIPCGLDFTDFGVDVPPERRAALTVGFPMRLDPLKGSADAIAAMSILRAHYGERLKVTTFGSRKTELPDWIEWLDYPSQAELRRFYNDQAIFILPSLFEGWGLPGVEAMACGAALVTTDNGGCRDYAFDGQTALVTPPRQPEQLAQAVTRLVEDGELRLRIAHAGQAMVQRFTWPDAIDRLSAVLGA